MEYYIDYDQYLDCFIELRQLVNSRTDVNFVVQTRYVGVDDHLVSLSSKLGKPVAAVAVMTIGQSYDVEDPHSYLAQAELLFKRYGGIPHYGKIHTCYYDCMINVLGERWLRFMAIRQQLDPHGMFLNQHLRLLFNL
jgi:hypothetical protein